MHKHTYNEAPSYSIKENSKITFVYICANRSGGYCHVRKEEVKNA